jgi:acyl carrier protein
MVMELRQQILECIASVAPEAELDALDESADLRDELDLDSMDFLNILMAIARKTGVEVPEQDYAQLDTLNHMTEYLDRRQTQTPKSASS